MSYMISRTLQPDSFYVKLSMADTINFTPPAVVQNFTIVGNDLSDPTALARQPNGYD